MEEKTEKSLPETAYDIIYDRIVKFNLAPGASVSDFTLSKELGISRAPVREAILRLVDEGLVKRKDHGFQVAEITSDDIRDLYEAREGIERAMLSLAIKRGITQDSVDQLRSYNSLLAECIGRNDVMGALEYDDKIHRYLASLCGNSRLLFFFDRIFKQVKRMNAFSAAQNQQNGAEEHERIFAAIISGDEAAACDALGENISRAKNQHISVLENGLGENWVKIARFIY